jgi:hypothetical protein
MRHVDDRLPALIDAVRLGFGNAFKLPLFPDRRLELSKHAQHIKEALPAGVLVSIGCSVARSVTPLPRSSCTMSCRSFTLRASRFESLALDGDILID